MIVELNGVGHLTDIALVADQMTPVTFRNPIAAVDGLVVYSDAAWYSRATAGGAQTAYAAGVPLVLSRAAGTLGDTDTSYFFSGTSPLHVITRDKASIYQPYILGDITIYGDLTTGNIAADSLNTGEITVDEIAEFTEDAGVTFGNDVHFDANDVDGTGDLSMANLDATNEVTADSITEHTADAGVDIEGVHHEDGDVNTAGTIHSTGVISSATGIQPNIGCSIYNLTQIVTAAGVETAMSTPVPKGAVILAVSANAQTALTAGGTTATWSLGVTGDVDKYGTAGFPTPADSIALNSKSTWTGDGFARLAADETIKLCAAETGGAAAGDTALTVGTVKIVVTYMVAEELADA